jgi:AraC-like DNA-binding protein
MTRPLLPVPEGLLRLSHLALGRSAESAGRQPIIVTPVPGLRLLRHPVRTAFEASIYEPVLCLILQGRKKTSFGERTLDMGAGECLLVSHDLPVVSRITQAPYLALLLDIELDVLRGLYDELGAAALDAKESRALEVHAATPPLLDALGRYLALTESSTDARVLAPMITREIHYRLLTAPFGGMLRRLIRHDSHASAIARAIAFIRGNFRAPMVVAELAQHVGMSVASFHRQFKAVTASSPLQYQKDLRLLEARRLLRSGAASVSTAAYEVGYESPNQFSREYARRFGLPPKDDLAKDDLANGDLAKDDLANGDSSTKSMAALV